MFSFIESPGIRFCILRILVLRLFIFVATACLFISPGGSDFNTTLLMSTGPLIAIERSILT